MLPYIASLYMLYIPMMCLINIQHSTFHSIETILYHPIDIVSTLSHISIIRGEVEFVTVPLKYLSCVIILLCIRLHIKYATTVKPMLWCIRYLSPFLHNYYYNKIVQCWLVLKVLLVYHKPSVIIYDYWKLLM